jgi:hypothetical protein
MKTKQKAPARSNNVAFHQILKIIPRHLVGRIARETGIESKARTFSVFSHLGAMLFAQITHAISLNDVCDWLRMKVHVLARHGLTPPSRNGLSHANKERDAAFMEKLFWEQLAHLHFINPSFAGGMGGKGLLRRFKVRIHAVDSTVIQLYANAMDWAKHRRRKAAAKMHLRLNLHTFLPSFALVDTAAHHDNKRAREVCAALQAGEIVVFDKAYVDFSHLAELDAREVNWVSRAKDNLRYRVKKNLSKGKPNIIKDQLIVLTGNHAGMELRRVVAWVEVDGQWREMVFLTNNLDWSPVTVCDLYRRRWDIEVFFKQVKQCLKLSNFPGHSANAVRWQVYSALLVYVLLRYMAHLSRWAHSFTRLFTVCRAAVWERINLLELLKSYGTAGGRFKVRSAFNQAWFPGFEPAGA